ncbi:hypothetical protein [Arthrobacter sp. ISL-85]|uniref:hypothetical protein n=1 Tax=Arthrobacter sp. ISL-85 TaxID=2819115 RepID=UPI001BE74565|nr:hypothetical protein [Arthrobacter sp. ISL-85]
MLVSFSLDDLFCGLTGSMDACVMLLPAVGRGGCPNLRIYEIRASFFAGLVTVLRLGNDCQVEAQFLALGR